MPIKIHLNFSNEFMIGGHPSVISRKGRGRELGDICTPKENPLIGDIFFSAFVIFGN